MQHARIEGATRVCGKSQGYRGLVVRDRADGVMITAWTPDPAELARLNAGASVHVLIMGTVPAPMRVEVGEAVS